MNGSFREEATGDGVIRAEPLYFPAEDPGLFGWLHPPAQRAAANIGIVICPPFGYEALTAHRTIRTIADVAAGCGIPTLRFDYRGTGDSTDVDASANQIALWTDDVVSAVSELRRRTGVRLVYLLGIRLGALLAVLAADRCDDVRGLMLVAPVVNGKRYLRELNTARLAAQLKLGTAASEEGDPLEPGAREFSGYLMSAASIESLSGIDLASRPRAGGTEILIIDRDDLPTAQAWSVAVRARYVALKGFVEMALVAPQFAVVPREMISALRTWLYELAGETESPVEDHHRALGAGPGPICAPELRLSVTGQNGPGQLTEHPVILGNAVQLFGLVTSPPASEARRRAVILLNIGADLHIGVSRLYVSLARKWAQSGYYVLRFDLAGLGDSATRPGAPIDDVFPKAALEDIGVAIEFMRSRYTVGEVTLAGLCSGAYHALRAAVAQAPVEHVIMVNPLNFFWGKDDSLQGLQIAEVVHNPRVYRERVVDAGAWKRLLSGKVNLWRIVQIYLYRQTLTLAAARRTIARLLHIRLAHDLGRELQDIVRKGTRVTFVFAKDEPGFALLRLEAGSLLDTLGANYRLRLIERADHTFTQRGPRSILEQVLSEELHGSFPRRGSALGSGS